MPAQESALIDDIHAYLLSLQGGRKRLASRLRADGGSILTAKRYYYTTTIQLNI